MTLVERVQQDQATELIRQVMAGQIVYADQLTVVSSRELTAAVGRRRVIQYVVEGLDHAGPTAVIAKTFSEPRRAQLLSTHLQELADHGFAVGRFRVPQLLAFEPEENLVLYRACTGTPLNEQMDNESLLDGVRDAARWLAKLHGSAVQLPRTFTVTQEASSTQEWATVIGRHSPEVFEPAQRLASRWAAGGSSFRSTPVPIHKDFHAGHLLRDDSVWVIDLDEARHGDRAFDLAHFCAYLEFTGDTSGIRQKAFLDEYARLTGWSDDGSLAWYAAYTWLKIAKQIAVRSGPSRTLAADRSWPVGDAVARGLACLAR
jgi:aminoglycoside phosphotransferase (APT) family kinase protein